MKIIGKNSSGFIVEMSKQELAHLAGFATPASAKKEGGCSFQEGDVVNVSLSYQRLTDLSRKELDDTFKDMQAAFNKLKDSLDKLPNIQLEKKPTPKRRITTNTFDPAASPINDSDNSDDDDVPF